MTARIEARASGGKTYLTNVFSTYPLRIIQQERWLRHASVSLLGFGGGMIRGDTTIFRISLADGAVLCVRTQGSLKIFKTTEMIESKNLLLIELTGSSMLYYLPDPTTSFAHSRFRQKQLVRLDRSSSLVLADWYTAGRTAEEWNYWSIRNSIEIEVDGEIILAENQCICDRPATTTSLQQAFGSYPIFGTLILCGPRVERIISRLKVLRSRRTFEHLQIQQQQQQQQSSREPTTSSSASKTTMSKTAMKFDISGSNLPKPSGIHGENTASLRATIVSVSEIGRPEMRAATAAEAVVVRFACMSTEAGYELLAEILKPAVTDVSGLTSPYSDRLHHDCDIRHRSNNSCYFPTTDTAASGATGEGRGERRRRAAMFDDPTTLLRTVPW